MCQDLAHPWPDSPLEQTRAVAAAGKLRAAGIAVRTYLRGNSKKQAERARKEGLRAILFVRSADSPLGAFHFTSVGNQADSDLMLVSQVRQALGERILGTGDQ